MTKEQKADWDARLEQLYTEMNHERADYGADLDGQDRENDSCLDEAMHRIQNAIDALWNIKV